MPSDDQIEMVYTCAGCGEHTFKVRYRGRDEDIAHYMDHAVKPALGIHHTVNSPLCRSTKCDLKIPMPESGEGIGMRTLS